MYISFAIYTYVYLVNLHQDDANAIALHNELKHRQRNDCCPLTMNVCPDNQNTIVLTLDSIIVFTVDFAHHSTWEISK